MSKPKKPTLKNDFERMIPEYHKGSITYGEHLVRYASTAELVRGKVVLDIASGSGYGTKLIAQTAKQVYGVDVSKPAVAYAAEYFGAKNIKYLVGDGQKIPLDDASVEVVVSFETIEHIKDYKQFMAEVKRVLKPDGLLILSTPNDLEFAEGNHFHLHEFTYQELKDLTEEYFKYNKSYFQGTWIYSALLDQPSIANEGLVNIKTHNHASLDPKKYLYFFMLCANRQITEQVTNVGSISEHWSARALQEKQQLTDQHVQNINDILESTQRHAKELQAVVADRERHIKNLEDELHTIKKNPVWKAAQHLHKTRAKHHQNARNDSQAGR